MTHDGRPTTLKLVEAMGIIHKAYEEHQPSHVFAMFSGGHDSLVSSHVANRFRHTDGVAHINTGIGIPRTRQFVRETCDAFGWRLLEYKALENVGGDGKPDPQVYEDLVLEWGFPGPGHHNKMYARLKERPLRCLIRDHKEHSRDRIMLISGLRRQESERRMAYDDPISRVGSQVWVNPCFNWSKDDCEAYMKAHSLPRNPVKDLLCISGECLCGAFARPDELKEIEAFFPDVGKALRELERRVKANGFPWGWDEEPPQWWSAHRAGQEFLPGVEPSGLPMCHSCIAKEERREGMGDDPVIERLSPLEALGRAYRGDK